MDFSSEPLAAPVAPDCSPRGPENDVGAPFVVIEPLRRRSAVVFASPHSGRRYPASMMAGVRASLAALRRSEDVYVDELFAGAAALGAPLISSTIGRALIDLNRNPSELDPDMFAGRLPAMTASPRVQAGLGAIPRVAGDGQIIYAAKLQVADADLRINAIHRPYHATLAGLIAEARAQFGCAILIDCHSMPSCARGPHAPDIVLGDRFGAACHPAITALVEATLRRMGYRVARNAPFAGGHTTQLYGRPALRVHALQIEINRGLYVDERTLNRTSGFARVRADMSRLGEALIAADLHKSLA
ncbi:MAG: N-formylglutamate amidohydrolase [Alphaproteobacteria bacterium]|nr:N-formylglutamate amidohydrolase [Alphaproteobacteria bacterium]